jgi:hypothetical protein
MKAVTVDCPQNGELTRRSSPYPPIDTHPDASTIERVAKVVLTDEAAAGLEALSNPIHGRVLKLLIRLEKWPAVSGAKPLRGGLAGSFPAPDG